MTAERGADAPPVRPSSPSTSPADVTSSLLAPSLRRRMACFVYEGLLLFGVALVPALVATIAFPRTGIDASPLAGHLVRGFALAVYAAYFVGCWSARGQTLAMQTWRIRLVDTAGRGVRPARALLRFIACCIAWFTPAMAIASWAHWPLGPKLGALGVGVAAYALLALAAPGRQFWHDIACGTRLVDVRGEPAPAVVRPRPR